MYKCLKLDLSAPTPCSTLLNSTLPHQELGIGQKWADFHYVGRIPDDNERLNIFVIPVKMDELVSFNIRPEIPPALRVSMDNNSSRTLEQCSSAGKAPRVSIREGIGLRGACRLRSYCNFPLTSCIDCFSYIFFAGYVSWAMHGGFSLANTTIYCL